MSSLIADFMLIGGIALLGAMSPGPDFLIVTKNALSYSRRAGLWTAFGVALAILIHVTYCVVGLGVLIKETPFLYHLLQYLGAAYLIYIGLQSFWSKSMTIQSEHKSSRDLPAFQAFKNGFFTNALNPKASLFFLSVFSQVIEPGTPYLIQFFLGIEMALIGLIWFSCLATVLSHPFLQAKVAKAQKTFDRILGSTLIALGLKIAFI